MKPRILFVFSIIHYHREWAAVVRHCHDLGWSVHVLIGWHDPANSAAAVYQSAGIPVLTLPDDLAYGDPHIPAVSPLPAPAPAATTAEALGTRFGGRRGRLPRLGGLPRLRSLPRLVRRARRFRRFSRQLVRDLVPDIMVTGTDHSCGRLFNGLIAAARETGRPVVGIGYSPLMSRNNAIRSRFHRLAMGQIPDVLLAEYDLLNRFLARCFPTWIQERDGVRLFMWDPVEMLAARLTGMIEPDPWSLPSERLDLYLAWTEHSHQLLERSGYPMERVAVCGVPMLDDVWRRFSASEERLRLFARLGLGPDARFILWNMEPSWEHGYARAEDHWQRVRQIAACLQASGLPVVVSLHPLCKYENYQFLETGFNMRIVRDERIYTLYPFCAFVVSFPCSTNFLAEVFGKPLIVLDRRGIAREGAPSAEDFRLPGALFAETLEELQTWVGRHAVGTGAPWGADASFARAGAAYTPACPRIAETLSARLGRPPPVVLPACS